ncbi:MAG: peptidyl-prolyl cis-trans isomerase [Candidatus Omnitrophota bacterium]
MIFKLLRKYIKVFLWAMAILIIPSFVLWGVGSGIRNRSRAMEAGFLFGRQVPWDEFDAAHRSTQMFLYLSELRAYAQFIDPVALAWDRLMLLREAKRRRIGVSNEEVVRYIQRIPEFQTTQKTGPGIIGRFDQKRYEEIIERSFRLSPRAFEEEVRKTLTIQKLRDQVVSEIAVDEGSLREEYAKRHNQRKITYLLWKTADFEKEASLTEKELSDYYAAHQNQLERKESARFAYLQIDFEKRSKEEARQLSDRIFESLFVVNDSGEERFAGNFEEASRTYEIPIRETGFVTPETLPEDLRSSLFLVQEIFRLDTGSVGDPFETENGILLVKLLEKRPPGVLSFEEAKGEIEKVLRAQAAERLCHAKASEALKALQEKMKAGTASWEEAVKGMGLSLKETPFFKQSAPIPPFGGAALGLAHMAFSLNVKEIGGVVRVPGGMAVLRVEAEELSGEEAFDKEKEAFRELLLAETQSDYYAEWLQTLRVQAQLVSNIESPQDKPSQ